MSTRRAEDRSLQNALSAAVLAAALALGAPQPAMLAARADDAEAGSAVDKRRLAVERRREMLAQARENALARGGVTQDEGSASFAAERESTKVAAADADVERSNAARQSEGQRMLDAIKGRSSDYGTQQGSSRAPVPRQAPKQGFSFSLPSIGASAPALDAEQDDAGGPPIIEAAAAAPSAASPGFSMPSFSLPSFKAPEMPKMPDLPAAPDAPPKALPSIPAPELPKSSLPAFPRFSAPAKPPLQPPPSPPMSIPQVPKTESPALPVPVPAAPAAAASLTEDYLPDLGLGDLLKETPKKEHAKPAPALPKAAEPTKAAKVDAAKPVPAPALKETQARSSKRHGLPLFLVELLLNAAIIAGLYGVVTGYNAVSSVASAITNWLQRQTERLAPPAEQR